MELAPGAVVGGKYRIERPLARGGMGSLWVARHVQLGSTVAIKFLDASFAASPAHRARFEREARAAASLKSPHVVQVHDYGFEGPAPYIVMELLEGEDLNHRLHRVRRMSLHDTARILAQVGKALRKAHEAGIAHRDLKPANLFLARDDDDEVVKILDFGIAKEQNATLGDATRTGEVIGSPHYMSPEQVRAERDVDHRTDLWSMGIILYRMLVGVLPFPGDQLGPVLARILTDPIPVPSSVAPDLPRTMDAFFARALARDKLQRFQSIHEMVEAFQAAIGGREAFPSISMSLGTGQVPAAGGTAVWSPPGQNPATLTGSALVTASGPITAGGNLPTSNPITGPGSIPILGPPAMAPPPAMAASGPITASGMHGPMGPSTGSVTAGGLATTGSTPRPKGAGVALVIGAIGFAAIAAIAVGFFVLRGSSDDEPATPAATPTAAASTAAPAVTPIEPAPSLAPTEPAPSADPSASASSADPPASPSSAPAASSSAATKAPSTPTAKPKTTAKPKEKWF